MKPNSIVYVQIVPITMTWINLKNTRESNQFCLIYLIVLLIEFKTLKLIKMWTYKLTASSQCLRANFCALSSLDKPFPTYQWQKGKKKGTLITKSQKKKNIGKRMKTLNLSLWSQSKIYNCKSQIMSSQLYFKQLMHLIGN